MDRYQRAVETLLAAKDFDEVIDHAWDYADTDKEAGCLFLRAGPVTKDAYSLVGYVGCLTQIKAGRNVAADSKLTERIRADPLIPERPEGLTKDRVVLERFAAYQREMDKMWPGRNPEEENAACGEKEEVNS